MMQRIISLEGFVNDSGKPHIKGMERFNEYFRCHTNKTFIMRIEVFEKGTVDSYVWYIMRVILPAWIVGKRATGVVLSQQDAVNDITSTCPIFCKDDGGVYDLFDWSLFKPSCEMSIEELDVAVEWLHLYCVEQLNMPV